MTRPVHQPAPSHPSWKEVVDFVESIGSPRIAAPPLQVFTDRGWATYQDVVDGRACDVLVVHKPVLHWFSTEQMRRWVEEEYSLTFQNDIFYVLAKEHLSAQRLEPREILTRLRRFEKEPLADRKIVFVHIPKVAGRSLYHELRKHVRRQVYLRPEYAKYRGIYVRQLNFLAGHLTVYEYGQLMKGRHCLWLVLLRKPEERLLSLRAHAQRDPGAVSFSDVLTKRSLPDMVKEDRWPLMAAASLRYVSGRSPNPVPPDRLSRRIESALAFLRQDNVLVGVQEDMGGFYARLAERTDFVCDARARRNVRPSDAGEVEDERRFLHQYHDPYIDAEREFYVRARELAGL